MDFSVVDRHMKSIIHENEKCSGEKSLNAHAKTFDLFQPAQSAQADMGRKFLPMVNFL